MLPSWGRSLRIQIGRVVVDERAREVSADGHRVATQPKVFDVLVYLVRNRHRVVTRDELRQAIWPEIAVGPDSITRALGEVRKLLRDRDLIRTYPSRGVRLVGTVTDLASSGISDAHPPGLAAGVAAIDDVLGRARDVGGMRVLIGPPGGGRTTLLRIAETRARAAGFEVVWASDLVLDTQVARSCKKPTVILHDDAHRGPALGDLDEVVATIARSPVVVIATCSSVARRDPRVRSLVAAATRVDPDAIVTLRPLDAMALTQLVEQTLGRTASPAGIAKLLALTGGNPRFALHVLHVVRERKRPLEMLDRLSGAICDRLHELVLADVGELGADVRSTLDGVSILDEPFTTEIAADIAELPLARVADALEEAAMAGLLTHAQARWDFAHGVVRCVLERDLLPSRRAALHARAAVSLERWLGTPPSQLERITRHYVAGASSDHRARTLELVRRVAESHLEAQSFGRAATWFSVGLDVEARMAVEPARRRDLWLSLGKALSRDGQMERAADAFASAESIAHPSEPDAVRRSFAAIAPILPQLVERFYALLFERYPSLPGIATRPAPLQRRMFGEAIAALADHADDPEWLRAHLDGLGRRHAEYGVTDEMYDWAREAFLDAMSDVMAPRRLDPAVRATWERTFDSITDLMKGARPRFTLPSTGRAELPPASPR